jgi:tetratricopeptide (TPR) repeat protein
MAVEQPKRGGPGIPVDVAALKSARARKGWSQKKLAHEIGSDARVIERIEARGTAALRTLADIAEVLEIDPLGFRLTTSPPSPGTPPLDRRFQLPAVVADFTGRENGFKEMVARLRGDGGRVGLAALRGMGGVGKTSLAVKVAHAVKDHYPDAQLFVERQGLAERPVPAAEAMARVIRAFQLEQAPLPDTVAELLPVYRTVLAGKRALILLDNAKDVEQVKDLVNAAPPVGFIVTSRDALALDGVTSLCLDMLSGEEALALFRRIVEGKGSDEELREVAELCGRLPLAVRVAGDFLRLHEDWKVSRYILALQDEGKRLGRLKGQTPEKDVEAVLALSAAELVRSNPELAERWQMLSAFPADFDLAAAAAVWNLADDDRPDLTPALDELTALLARSLVQHDGGTDRYGLHDLMRPVARAAFDYVKDDPRQGGTADRLESAARGLAEHYLGILIEADHLFLTGRASHCQAVALFDQEKGNIRHGQLWAAARPAADAEAARWCRNFALHGAHILGFRLSPRELIEWMELALQACRRLGDRRGEGMAHNNLGVAYADLGNTPAAITSHDQQLTIARETGDRHGEAAALGNLGRDYSFLGQPGTAQGFYEQALEIAREVKDRRYETVILTGLGLTHSDRGDYLAAVAYHEQALQVAREIGDRASEGNVLGNLGLAHAALGDPRRAIDFQQQHLAIAREIGDRDGEGNALGNLGLAYSDLQEFGTAIAYFQQHLAIARETGDRRDERGLLFNLGLAHAGLSDFQTAIAYHEKSLLISGELGDQRGQRMTLDSLGRATLALGRHHDAIGYFERARTMARELGDRRGEGQALDNLARTYAGLGDFRTAIGYCAQAVAAARELEDRGAEANSSFNLALCCDGLNQVDKAIAHAEYALALYEALANPRAEQVRGQLARWRGHV